ncbi:MAG TPA: TetR/AcrR family transcriptional regulator [Methanocella sp.]|nr:TetR/AcrR family transcriptional regulator [Methanocella sp.]
MAEDDQRIKNVPHGPAIERTTRERILDAALDLFAEKGFDAVSLREIAEVAGVRKATLYYYFTTKDEILEKIFEYSGERWLNSQARKWPQGGEFEEIITSLGLEGFMTMAEGVFTGWVEDPRVEKMMRIVFVELYHNDQVRKGLREMLDDGGYAFFEAGFATMAKHKLIKPYDPKVLALEYISFYMNAFTDYFLIRYGSTSGSFIQEYSARIKEHTKFMTNSIKP